MNCEDQADLNTQLMDTVKQKLEYRRNQQIQFIVSQTNYDECEALEKLESCSNDVVKVVSDYLGITPKEDQNLKKTKNQKVYSVIREIMDKGSNNHRMQQEKAKKIEEMNEFIKRRQACSAAAAIATKKEQPCNDLETCNEVYLGCNAILKEKID